MKAGSKHGVLLIGQLKSLEARNMASVGGNWPVNATIRGYSNGFGIVPFIRVYKVDAINRCCELDDKAS